MLHATIARRVLFLSVLILLIVGQAGSASAWRAVWTSDRPESAQPPQGKLSTYIQVVGQFDTVDYERDPASAFALQETIIVPVDGSSALSTTTLEIGVVYQIRASGTFFVGGPGDMLGDAEYAQFNNPPSSLQNHCGGDPNDVDLGIGINDNVIDNVKVPFWGDYEPSHVYAINFVGEGSPINLNYHDCSYVDNSGSLMVEVWRPVVNTWHIATHGSDVTGDGSEANPFATIQHGIDMASDGDTVLAHPGTYTENIDFIGKEITVGSLFITTGDADHILQTVIDGNRSDRVVTFAAGEAGTARLSGFTITNGYAEAGGGVFCAYSDPSLTNLRITDNESQMWGGGLYFDHCSPTLRNIAITNNRAGDDGGGILYASSNADLENVVVAHNSTRNGGAGIFFYWTDGLVRNALIVDNVDIAQSGNRGGGGAMFDGSSPTLVNVTVAGNRTTGSGGGLNVSFMSQPTLVNSIVCLNTPEQVVFDQNWMGMAITIEHSDIEGGQEGIITHDLGPVNWGEGNLDTSPRFVHAGLGNYRLADNSPVIGAGRVAGAPNTDIEGNPRPNPAGSDPDMGAYENTRGLPLQANRIYLPLAPHNALSLPPLLVQYDFEDDFLASGTILDRSGNGHDAQVMGEVAAGAGISGGQGISLDGNGYVQAASNPAAGKTDITFSLWFKTDQPGENYKLASAAWWDWDLRASGWIIGTHIPEFWSDDESGLYLPGIANNDNGFQASAWNHEVITYDGSRIKEYTNGQLINDWPTTGAAIGTGLPMAIGAWPMYSGYNFQGSLDEFAIYDRSLTQQEVQALYAQAR